jgi:hypothetical protein
MFIPNLKQNENEIGSLLEQNIELETLSASLLTLFQGNKLHFCDFFYFSFVNRLYPEESSLVLKAIYLRMAHEIGLNRYIHALWVVEQAQTSTPTLQLFSAFTKTQKFNEIFKIKTGEIRLWLESLIPNIRTEEAIQQIQTVVSSLPFIGPDPCVLGLMLIGGSNSQHQIFDNFEEPTQVCQRIKTLASSSELSLSLDFPIPLPYEIPIECEEMLTPFPLILEAPMINPCLRYGTMIKELLGSLSKLSDDELGVI